MPRFLIILLGVMLMLLVGLPDCAGVGCGWFDLDHKQHQKMHKIPVKRTKWRWKRMLRILKRILHKTQSFTAKYLFMPNLASIAALYFAIITAITSDLGLFATLSTNLSTPDLRYTTNRTTSKLTLHRLPRPPN